MTEQERQFIVDLGLPEEGWEELNGSLVYHLKDSNDYARAYTILDKSDLVDVDVLDTISIMSDDSNVLNYIGDDFDISLEANFEEDDYIIKIMKAKE